MYNFLFSRHAHATIPYPKVSDLWKREMHIVRRLGTGKAVRRDLQVRASNGYASSPAEQVPKVRLDLLHVPNRNDARERINTRRFFEIYSLGACSHCVLYLQDDSPLLLASRLHCPSVESF